MAEFFESSWPLMILIELQIADVLTTKMALTLGIPEGNPVMAAILATMGDWAGLISSKVFFVVAICILWRYGISTGHGRKVVISFVMIYTVVVLNNLSALA